MIINPHKFVSKFGAPAKVCEECGALMSYKTTGQPCLPPAPVQINSIYFDGDDRVLVLPSVTAEGAHDLSYDIKYADRKSVGGSRL